MNERLVSRTRRRGALMGQSALCGALSLAAYGLVPVDAAGEPAGTNVISGDVTIHTTGKHTEFRQTTGTAILTHDSFNIRADESVHFKQPTVNSLAVNRVIGKDMPSTIAGKLTATGNVWVINPSGVAISKGAEVNVNGLIATTADITNDKILSGDRTFTGAPDGSTITNGGTITGGKGSIVLVAPNVRNTGTITTNGSDVALGAGSGFTVDMDGDGLTKFEVTPADGVKITANGSIRANGGAVYMSAESKSTVREAVVSVGGKVEATRVEEKGGVVYIVGNNGRTEVSGTIDASQTKGAGGKIAVTGDTVVLRKTARLDASGATDGGTVHIGGGYKGKQIDPAILARTFAPDAAPVPNARMVLVERGATIKVDAGAHGKGGEAVVWSDDSTAFYGDISARGGFLSGDGGLVEVSGKINLAFDGTVDTSAPFGKRGTLLLDPTVVNIVEGPGLNDGELGPADFTIDELDGGATIFVVSDDAIQSALVNNDVTIAATDAINMTGTLDLNPANANTLILDAGGDFTVTLGSAISMGDNPLVVMADGAIAINGTITSTANVSLTAGTTLTVDASVSTGGGDLSLTSVGTLTIADDGTVPPNTLTTVIDTGGGTLSMVSTGGRVVILDGIVTGNGNATVAGAEIDFENDADAVLNAGTGTVTLTKSITTDPLDTDPVILTAGNGVDQNNAGTEFDFVIDQGELDKITAGSLVVNSSGRGIVLDDTSGALNVARFDSVQLNSGGANVTIESVETELVIGGPTTLTTDSFDIVAGAGNVVFSSDSTFQALTVTSAGTVTQSADVSVVGVTSITATGAVTLEDGDNDFGGIVNVSTTGAVSIVDDNLVTLGVLTGSSVSISATDVAIDSTFSATSITLTNSADDGVNIGGAADANDATFELTDADLVEMAGTAVTVVTDGGGGSDVTLESVTFGSALTVDAGDDVILGATAHDFTGTTFTAIAGDDITQAAGGALVAGTVVFTADAIIQADATANITANTGSFTANNGDIELIGANNFISINADGDDVTINDVSAIILGEVTVDGDLTVTAAGSIQDTAGSSISVSGETTLVAAGGGDNFDILLDNSDTVAGDVHDFDDTVSATGEDIFIRTVDQIVLGTITPNDDSGGTVDTLIDNGNNGDLTLSVVNGDFDINSTFTTPGELTLEALDGNITQSVAFNVTGEASLIASGSITLDDVNNTFGTEINANGNGVTLVGDSMMNLGTVISTGDLSVSALGAGNDITDVAVNAADQISVTGTTSLAAADDIVLDDGQSRHVFGDTVTASAESIILRAGAGLTVGDFTATDGANADNDIGTNIGNVTLTGDVSLAGTSDLRIFGPTNTTITQTGGSIIADTLLIDAAGSGTVTLDQSGNDVTTLTNSAGVPGSISFTDTNDLVLGAITTGALTISTGGAVTNTGTVSVTGATAITTTGDTVSLDFATNNFGGSVSVDTTGGGSGAAAVTINDDVDGLTLGAITASTLTITADGTITDTLGSAVSVTGTTSISATDGGAGFSDIVLDNVGTGAHTFGGAVTATGEDIHLVTTGAFDIGAITLNDDGVADGGAGNIAGATGSLTIRAGGTITQSQALVVPGALDVRSEDLTNAGEFSDIVLMNGANSVGGTFIATGEDISFTNSAVTGITLGAISVNTDGTADNGTATGDLVLIATAGGISDGAGATTVVVAGNTSLSATGDVTLDNVGNDFADAGGGFEVDVTGGAITLRDDNDGINFGTVSGTSMELTSSGAVTQTGGGQSIAITGTTTINAAGSAVTLTEATNDFSNITGTSGSFQIVEVLGTTIGGLDLTALVATAGDINVFSNDSIFAQGGIGVVASNDVRLESTGALVSVGAFSGSLITANSDGIGGGDVTLIAANGTVGGAVGTTISGDNVTMTGRDVITGAVTASAGNIAATANTTSIVIQGAASVSGNMTLDAVTFVTADNVANAIGGTITASGTDITLVEANDVLLGDIDAGGNLTVTALAGTITDDGDGLAADDDINVVGTTSLSASGNITLDDVFNDFDSDLTGDALTFAGATISLFDQNRLTIGASTSTGNVTIRSEDVDITGPLNVNGGAGTLTLLNRGGSFGAGDIFGGGLFGTIYNLSNADVENISASILRFEADQPGSTFGSNNFNTSGTDGTADNFGTLQIDVNEVIFTALGGTDSIVGNLEVETNTSVRQGGGGSLNVTGSTSITAAPLDVTLNNTANTFGGVIDINGTGDVDIGATGDIILGDLDITVNVVGATTTTGSLTVTAIGGGNIVDDGPVGVGRDINVEGTTSLSAGGDIVLDDTFHDFNNGDVGNDPVNAAAVNITLNDTDAIILGDIDATGNMTVTAGGSITDDGNGAMAGNDINVDGETSLSADGNITLDDTFNDFDAVVSGDAITADGDDIVITDDNAIVLGNVTASSTLSITAGGAITQEFGSTVLVAGNTTIDATGFAVSLTNTTNDFADTAGAGKLDVIGTAVSIRDIDSINLGGVTASSFALTTLNNGNVTQSGGGQTVSVSGITTISALGGNVTLTEGGNDFTTLTGAADSFDIEETDGLSVAALTANAGNIEIESTGFILGVSPNLISATGNVNWESTGGGNVRLVGTSQILANSDGLGGGDATLTSNGGTVGGDAGASISGDNVTLSGGVAQVPITTATTGAVTVTATTGAITVGGAVTANTSITGMAATDIAINADMMAADLSLTTTDGDINQTAGSIAITGETSLVAGGAGQNINLGILTNDFNTVNASAADDAITLGDTDNIILGTVNGGSLSVNAGGSITDVATRAITIGGVTSLVAESGGDRFDIVLDNADTHNFSDTAAFNATGEDITVDDIDGILLGNVTATDDSGGVVDTTINNGSNGDLTVEANGDVGQFAGTAITVPGLATLNSAGNAISLSEGGNDFSDTSVLGGEGVTGMAASFVLVDANNISVGNLTATTVGVTATTGFINQVGGTTVDVSGTTTLTAGTTVTMDEASNDFGTVNASGTGVTLFDTDEIVLDSVTVTTGGSLSVTAEGNIDDATGSISVSGTTSLLATDGGAGFSDIVLDNGLHDFGGTSVIPGTTLGDAVNEVDATGANITLTDVNAIKLGAVTATGTLSVSAVGSITDTAGKAISITGSTSLAAVDDQGTPGTGDDNFFDIRLDGDDGNAADRPHDFSTVTFLGEGFVIVDANAITVNGNANTDAFADPTLGGGGDATVDAGGDVELAALETDGNATVTTDASLTVTNLNAGGGLFAATGGDALIVTLQTTGDVFLTTSAELTLTDVTAGGDITTNAAGRTRIGTVESTGGFIDLYTDDYFSILPGNPTPLTAATDILLAAPNGGFLDAAATAAPGAPQSANNLIPAGLSFTAGNLIEFSFNVGFTVTENVVRAPGTPALAFTATAAVLNIKNGLFAIGSESFLTEVRGGVLDPFRTNAAIVDPTNLLLRVDGQFGLVTDGTLEVRLQNKAPVVGSQDGSGAIVTGTTFLGGMFSGLSLFGEFAGTSGVVSANGGFESANVLNAAYPAYAINSENTANGCVILASTSCTPLGSVVPVLDFEDGRLLSIKFVDPTEDEDDPFSNRGDEEEWE